MSPVIAKSTVDEQARALGFGAFGVCRPDAVPAAAERLHQALKDGHHGTMNWLEDRVNWRSSPEALWPEARSVIMLADIYTPDDDPLELLAEPDRGAISVYARGKDYHDLVKKRLKALGRWLIEEGGGSIKVFVDTAPVMEKPLGAAAGLGWQGKHTNLVSRDIGNWFFLGAIFTTLELEPDTPGADNCGSCRACLDICPTNAFPEPYRLDARKCISYLTIEHRDAIDPELQQGIGDWIYGCDICQEVCPHNSPKPDAQPINDAYASSRDRFDLLEVLGWDEDARRDAFQGSAMKRAKLDMMQRNARIVARNQGLDLDQT